jgi:hypothetical protein
VELVIKRIMPHVIFFMKDTCNIGWMAYTNTEYKESIGVDLSRLNRRYKNEDKR